MIKSFVVSFSEVGAQDTAEPRGEYTKLGEEQPRLTEWNERGWWYPGLPPAGTFGSMPTSTRACLTNRAAKS